MNNRPQNGYSDLLGKNREITSSELIFGGFQPYDTNGGGPTEAKQYYSGYSSVVSERKIEQSIEASYVGGENACAGGR